MAHKKSKPARKSVSSKVFVARMREVKASKATRSHNAADKMLQNPGSQKKNNAVAVMAEVRRSTKECGPYEAFKNSLSSPPQFFHRGGAKRLTRPLRFK